MLKHEIIKSNIDNDDLLITAFEEFYQKWLSQRLTIESLTEIQKQPVIAFIYATDVWRGGHFVFLDLNFGEISIKAVVESLEALNIDNKYINNLAPIASDFAFPSEWPEDDGQYETLYRQIVNILDPLDSLMAGHDAEDEFINKTLAYIRSNYLEFFEIID